LCHRPTGTRVSPERGIHVDGVSYTLCPADIDLPRDSILGAGSGGVVQVGVHKPSGMRVAVKTLRVGGDEEKRELMLKEIKGLAQSEGCPYLIQLYGGFADRAAGCVRVAVEYMDLGSLADLRRRLDGRGLPAGHVGCVAAQVMSGLHFLQLRKVLHRDVKPENILHNRTGQVKLTDFGISKVLGSAAGVGVTFVGTATYMAPERACGEDYGFASDIWSAGMVIYELATGRHPLAAASFPELLEALTESPVPRLEEGGFPSDLRDFVACCLTRDAARRPDAAALVGHVVVAGLNTEHVALFAAFLADLPD